MRESGDIVADSGEAEAWHSHVEPVHLRLRRVMGAAAMYWVVVPMRMAPKGSLYFRVWSPVGRTV